jgi:hypothetical protein
MSPETLNLIKEISLDAIKILGPAIITGVLAFKVAKAQSDVKNIQIRSMHEFKAREYWFKHYLRLQEEKSKSIHDSYKALGQAIAMLRATEAIDDIGLKTGLLDMIKLFSRVLPSEIRNCLGELDRLGLSDSQEYMEVGKCRGHLPEISDDASTSDLIEAISGLMQVDLAIEGAYSLMIDKQQHEVFKAYLK